VSFLGTSKGRQETRVPSDAAGLGAVKVRDLEGREVRLGDLWEDQPAVLVFLRRFSSQTMVGVYNMTTESQKLPRWVVPLGNWAWDALTDETPLTDGPLTLDGYQVRWFVQQT